LGHLANTLVWIGGKLGISCFRWTADFVVSAIWEFVDYMDVPAFL
jgi:hypothetical protein